MFNGAVSLLFLFLAVVSARADPTFNDDVLGLIVFKAGLDDPLSKLSSWNSEDYDPCNWVGCTCDPATNRVSELRLDAFSLSGHIGRGLLRLQFLHTLVLSNNNLTGTLNPEFPHLGSLQVVDFSGNNLSGRIPDGFFEQCGSLRSVSLANNKLTGSIPVSLSYCSTLTHLNLSSNQLSGRLPRDIWFLKSLKSLDFSHNFLQGDIPDGLGGLYDLRHINLSRNWFSGDVPSDIGRCSSLKSLDLSENYFSGNLPDSMKSLGSCSSIRLRGNSLIGEIPDWIGDIATLEILDLSANNFTGTVPFSLGNLEFLKDLNLSANMLAGELPQTLSNCSNLISIDVSKNSFTGDVLKWMFTGNSESSSLSRFSLHKRSGNDTIMPIVGFLQGLRVLDLSSNGFTGELPSNIWILTSLLQLNMSTNSLFGSIPTGIGGLKVAEILDLSSNLLNGTLPSEIGGAVSLKQLHLHRNRLSGQIPAKISNCSALNTINLSENELSGAIPGSIGSLSNLEYIDLSRNNLSGSLPKEIEKLSHLLTFNISHNNITGELPAGGFFNTIPLSAVTGNPSLCGSVVNRSCLSVHPKPIVLNPNSSNPTNGPALTGQIRKSVLSISALIAIGAAAVIAIGVVAVTLLNVHARSSVSRHDAAAALALSVGETFSCSPSKDQEFGKLVMFSGEVDVFDTTGADALLNKDSELGRGGFGVVYKTSLQDGRPVAVKKLTVSGLIKSQEEFEREMRKLGKLRHKNVVEIKGYYWTQSLQLLIHEFVSGGSLYRHLHGDESVCLTWRQRFSIILGIARGVKLTIVGRVEDGLPLAQDQTYVNQEDNTSFLLYKQQAEFLLKQVSKDSLLHPKMTILLDHHSFHFLVEKKICYIALSDSSYPRKLLFNYLQNLNKELDKLDEKALIQKISKPYSFIRFGKIIGRIRKQYIDTRTQANLSKLNALRKQELDVVTEHLNDIIQRQQILETLEKASSDPPMIVSTIWSSRCLQDISLKWTPVTIIILVILVLFKASLIMTDDYLISTMI